MTTISTIRPLANNQYLVTGLEAGQEQVLDGTVYRQVMAAKKEFELSNTFDSEVQKFFEPLTKAAEARDKATQAARDVSKNKFQTIVLQKGAEGVAAREQIELPLDDDGAIINAALNAPDSLVWVAGKLYLVG